MHNPMNDKVSDIFARVIEAIRKKGGEGKIHFTHSESISVKYEAGRLKDTGSEEKVSFSIDVLKDGRIGRVSGNRLDDIGKMIENAFSLSKVGSEAHFAKWPTPSEIAPVKKYSAKTTGLSREKIIESCKIISDRLKQYSSDMHSVCSGRRFESEDILATSGGVMRPSKSCAWGLNAMAQKTEGTDMLMAGDGRYWCDLNELYSPEIIAGQVIDDLAIAEKHAHLPSGRYKMLFSPEILGMSLSPAFMGINGRNVAKGDSPLKGKIGEKIFSDAITVEDNPHLDFCPYSDEIDGDGIATRKQMLFDKGVLKTFLYDLDSAGLAGAVPTGNKGCRPYFPKVSPGKLPHKEMIKGIHEGVFVKMLMGFGQGNIINGDFSCNLALGYLIRNGELAGRLKDTMISGNIYDIFKNNTAMSSDTDFLGMNPYCLLEGVNLSSKG